MSSLETSPQRPQGSKKSASLAVIPPSPPGRSGWPWNVESTETFDSECPRITVVIPSFEQGQFLEECIRSILLQNYPNLELFVFDGGSSDNTREILQRYDPWIDHWISAPDEGQTHAINQGFERASGAFVAWQNSDDFYHANAFAPLIQAIRENSDGEIFFGDKDCIDVNGGFLRTEWSKPPTWENMIPWPCIHSEVTFFHASLFKQSRRLDQSFRHYMDFSLFWDFLIEDRKFVHVPGIRASFRRHSAAKSSVQGAIAQSEAFEIYRVNFHRIPAHSPSRTKLINAMRDECLNDWGAFRFKKFRQHFRELWATAGIRALSLKLSVVAIFTLFPVSWVRRIKRS